MKARHLKKSLAALGLVVLASGCAPVSKTAVPTPTITPPAPQAASPLDNRGSLFSSAYPTYLYEDNRARRIGDIVMVNIVENTTSKTKAKTKTRKDSKVNMGVNAAFGQSEISPTSPLSALGLPLPGLGMVGAVGTSPAVQAQSKNEFDSDGETSRDNTVSATVGCRIVNILPGNVMQVEGARQVKVNNENQILVIRGLIRAQDIGPDNAVPSSNMADAQIELYGEGVLADRQKPGWLARILDNIWPF